MLINFFFGVAGFISALVLLMIFVTRKKLLPYLTLMDRKKAGKLALKIFGWTMFFFLVGEKTTESFIIMLILYYLVICLFIMAIISNCLEKPDWIRNLSLKQTRKMKLQRIKRRRFTSWR